MRVVLIRHEDDPMDDRVTSFLRGNGIEPEVKRPFHGEPLGSIDGSVAASVIYGGKYSVFEEEHYPFLHQENDWIEQCIGADIPLLGICQGAQSIAHVLGAHVGPKPGQLCEFGYYELMPTQEGMEIIPHSLFVAQSHHHDFQLPAGAKLLARSRGFERQAFSYGPVTFAFQFHPEVTPDGFRRWQNAPWARYGWPGAQSREEQDRLMALHDDNQDRWFKSFLLKFFAPILERAAAGQEVSG